MSLRERRDSQNCLDERQISDSVRELPLIDLSRFSATTELWLSEKFGHKFGEKIDVREASYLWFLLRITPEEEFPSGMWATIQMLEGVILEALKSGNVHATSKRKNT